MPQSLRKARVAQPHNPTAKWTWNVVDAGDKMLVSARIARGDDLNIHAYLLILPSLSGKDLWRNLNVLAISLHILRIMSIVN